MATAAQTDVASPQMQLLLVSESTDDASYLRSLLERNGDGQLNLQHARNCEAALECMRHTTFDLLLCNFTPGEGTALRLMRDLRREGARVPVVFLSDHVDEVASDAAIRAGATGSSRNPSLITLLSRVTSSTLSIFTARNGSASVPKICFARFPALSSVRLTLSSSPTDPASSNMSTLPLRL